MAAGECCKEIKGERYLKLKKNNSHPRTFAKRLSMNKKWRERRRLKKAALLAAREKELEDAINLQDVKERCSVMEEPLPTCTEVAWLTLPVISMNDLSHADKLHDVDVKNVKKVEIAEGIMEKMDFEIDEQYESNTIYVKTEVLEEIEEPLSDEIPTNELDGSSTKKSDKEINDVNVPSDTNSEHNLVIEQAEPQETEKSISKGIDFTDFAYVFNQIIKLGDHSNIGCGVKYFQITGFQQQGLKKVYNVQCRMCNHLEYISCLQENASAMDINHSAVSVTMITGGGYNQLEELLSSMNVSCMSKNIYEKCHNEVIDAFELAAQREMENAGKLEKELAIARGDVFPGTNLPWISVVTDGSWMKRSYRRGGYNSLFGVGAIVGYHTKKVLYISVKNKFCYFCQRAEKNNEKAQEHRCFKNWGRHQSSTGMESAAIVEGFKCSVEMHGLIYSILVADGDSSVYKKILDNDPYKDYAVRVRKVECTNHLLRNFHRKVNETVAKGPIEYREIRKAVKENVLRLRAAVRKAAQYRFKEKQSLDDQIKNLRADMKNVPSHIFGEHKECQRLAYFCKKHSDPNVINYVPKLKESGIYQRIEEAMQPLFSQTESLLYGLNNNAAECFNNIIAKFIGGKRINFRRKGSYQGRVSAAVVQFNSKEVLSRLNKKPSLIVKRVERRRKLALQNAIRSKAIRASAARYAKQHPCDKDYGPNAEQVEMDETSTLNITKDIAALPKK